MRRGVGSLVGAGVLDLHRLLGGIVLELSVDVVGVAAGEVFSDHFLRFPSFLSTSDI
jgi:hypothetical protein